MRRLEILVGGRDPDEIFKEGEDRTRRARAAQEQADADRRDADAKPGSEPDPAPKPVAGEFKIRDTGDSFEIWGVRYRTADYTVSLSKTALSPDTPQTQSALGQRANALLKDPTVNNREFHAASAPFYIALFETLHANRDHQNAGYRALVKSAADSVYNIICRHKILTLTQITYNRTTFGWVNHNAFTGRDIGYQWDCPYGQDGLINSLPDRDDVSDKILRTQPGHLDTIVRWLTHDLANPSLYRYPAPQEFAMISPVSFSFTGPTFLIKATGSDRETGASIGVRIYDKDSKGVLP